MRNRIISIMKISSPSALLLFFMAGCISPPVLLRNRPNVPPPVVESSLENQPLSNPVSAPVAAGVEEQAPIVVNVPEALPPPDIKTAPLTYTVVKGDSYWKIARMYGVTKEELATCNNLSLKKPLKVGTVLLIPPGGEFIPPEKRTKVKPAPRRTTRPVKTSYTPSASDGTYTVRKGDSLWKIARRYNVSTAQLVKANHIDARRPIKPGDKLVIPGAAGKINSEPVSAPEATVPETIKQPTPDTKEQTEPKKSNDPLDDILNDSSDTETDDVFDAAMNNNAKPTAKTPVKKTPVKIVTPAPPASTKNVVDELDKAVSVSNTDVPGSLYIEEVLPNETLQEIADRHGCTVEEILAVNPGLSANKALKPFSSIKIPNK